MAFSRALASDFWLRFDDQFLPGPQLPPVVRDAYRAMDFDFDGLYGLMVGTRRAGTFPAAFVAGAEAIRPSLETLSREQLGLVDASFPGDADAVRLAFEDFGQGVLFDARRPRGRKVHMMDTSGPDSPPIGYHRWHGFNCGFIALGIGAARWLEIARCVGLAWEIQSILKPVQDRTDNPELDPATLASLREKWLGFTADQLDEAFMSEPYPAGVS
jgi:hypothetical protein